MIPHNRAAILTAAALVSLTIETGGDDGDSITDVVEGANSVLRPFIPDDVSSSSSNSKNSQSSARIQHGEVEEEIQYLRDFTSFS
jgi:hypothetical protein